MNHTTISKNGWLIILFSALFFLFPTFISPSHAVLAFIIVTWIVTFDKHDYKLIVLRNKVILILGLLFLMVLLGLSYKPDTGNWNWALLHLKKYAIFVYAIIIILLLANRNTLQRIALNSFIAGMLFVLISTWLNIWFLLPWSKSQQMGWGYSHHVFGDYVTQGIMMAFFAIIALHKTIQGKYYKTKIFWSIVTFLTIISITHLLQGRTGLLVLIAGLLTYALITIRGKWLIVFLASATILMGTLIGSSKLIKSRINEAIVEAQQHNINRTSSIGHRLYNYKTTAFLIMERPLLGHGTGAYHTEICRIIGSQDACEMYTWHPHNQFLFFGVDHGIIGILLYVLLLFSLYHTALRSSNRDAKIWLSALTSILLVDSLFNSPFYSSRESQFFGYMIALLVSMCITQQDPTAESASDANQPRLV